MKPATAIVVTTIFEPQFLSGYLDEIRAGGCEERTRIIIIPDRKTPPSVGEAALAARRQGFPVDCPSLNEQETFLRGLGVPDDFFPYNTDNRRNVGFLMALADGCEVLVSIDDDNYCRHGSDFVGEHAVVGREATDPYVVSSDGWFNIGSLLETEATEAIFPRGFPYAKRQSARQVELRCEANPVTVAMNAGLWLQDPDVDAVSRLANSPQITRFRGPSVVLGPDVWSPINTQNTALTREAASTYYYIRMGFPLQGLAIDRFGDILSGYLTQKCIKHLGHAIRVGTPIVDHRRTPHNLFKDLYHELAGMVLIEDLLPWLIEEPLEGGTYLEAYRSLSERLDAAAERFGGFVWDDGGRTFVRSTASRMREWITIVKRIT